MLSYATQATNSERSNIDETQKFSDELLLIKKLHYKMLHFGTTSESEGKLRYGAVEAESGGYNQEAEVFHQEEYMQRYLAETIAVA